VGDGVLQRSDELHAGGSGAEYDEGEQRPPAVVDPVAMDALVLAL
jgi:hypothetical protein